MKNRTLWKGTVVLQMWWIFISVVVAIKARAGGQRRQLSAERGPGEQLITLVHRYDTIVRVLLQFLVPGAPKVSCWILRAWGPEGLRAWGPVRLQTASKDSACETPPPGRQLPPSEGEEGLWNRWWPGWAGPRQSSRPVHQPHVSRTFLTGGSADRQQLAQRCGQHAGVCPQNTGRLKRLTLRKVLWGDEEFRAGVGCEMSLLPDNRYFTSIKMWI